MGSKDDTTDTCEREARILTRPEKRAKLERIYSKSLDIIFEQLGIDKDSVYAACQALQTAGRELKALEFVMKMVGELDENTEETKKLAVYEITDQDAVLEKMFAEKSVDA
jgi:hypothetical protein